MDKNWNESHQLQVEAFRRMELSFNRLARLLAISPPAPAVIVENERRLLQRRILAFPVTEEIKECVDQMEAAIAADAAMEQRDGDSRG